MSKQPLQSDPDVLVYDFVRNIVRPTSRCTIRLRMEIMMWLSTLDKFVKASCGAIRTTIHFLSTL